MINDLVDRVRADCAATADGARKNRRTQLMRVRWRYACVAALAAMGLGTRPAQASMFQGETLDSVANVLSWVVLVVVPIVAIAAFWLVHILPEKIAYKKHHPQAKAIHTLCLLSLVFGGILWPLAWIWAYTKPVLHKMAYGTDVDMTHADEKEKQEEQKKAIAAELELEKVRGQVLLLAEQMQAGAKGRKA